MIVGHDIKKHDTPFALMEIFMRVASKMTKKEQLYWSRSEEELIKMLKKGKFEFLVEGSKEGIPIPVISQGMTKEVLYKSPFRKINLNLGFLQDLQRTYPGTEQSCAFDYTLACLTYSDEIVVQVGGKKNLKQLLFTPGQIAWLASKQNKQDAVGPLVQNEYSNYFLILDKDNTISLLSLFWRKNGPTARNRWEYWIYPNILKTRTYLRSGSKLFIIA